MVYGKSEGKVKGYSPDLRTMSRVIQWSKLELMVENTLTMKKLLLMQKRVTVNQTSQRPQRKYYIQNFIQPIHQVCS